MEQEVITEDKFLDGRVRLLQPDTGYRAAMDAVLLASAVPASKGQIVMDLGSGVGAVSLCLAARVGGCRIEGVELQSELVALGEKNIRLNNFGGRIRFFVGDISKLADCFRDRFDHVMINPPYLQSSRAQPSRNLDPARVEVGADLTDWVNSAISVLRNGGSMTFIHRADRLDELLGIVRIVSGDISLVPIWPGPGKAAKRVIVLARKGRGGPLRFCPGLTLHKSAGGFTNEAIQIFTYGGALAT